VKRILPFLVALALLGVAIILWQRSRILPARAPQAPRPVNLSRFDAAFDRHLTELAEVPAFKDRLQGLPRSDLREAIQGLAAKGMRRLGDERLTVRTRIVGRMLQGLDVETCSAMATGRQNETVHDAAVIVLDPESLDEWVALSFDAARAELEQAPAQRPTPQELQLALGALLKRVPEADSERLRQALGSLSEQTPAEACWAARTTYAAVPSLPVPVARVLERELAGP
jgi:hypothetical protein